MRRCRIRIEIVRAGSTMNITAQDGNKNDDATDAASKETLDQHPEPKKPSLDSMYIQV
jgi:hypothetical protein